MNIILNKSIEPNCACQGGQQSHSVDDLLFKVFRALTVPAGQIRGPPSLSANSEEWVLEENCKNRGIRQGCHFTFKQAVKWGFPEPNTVFLLIILWWTSLTVPCNWLLNPAVLMIPPVSSSSEFQLFIRCCLEKAWIMFLVVNLLLEDFIGCLSE